ncbi:isocitrate lyase/phosphoenolpyruvate mutase family protein [Streptomyces nogalater]
MFIGNGLNPRALHAIADRDENFYMMGSMGLALPLAIGFSRQSGRTALAVEGDGNTLMGMSAMALAPAARGTLVHIVLDNQVYESTGGQRSPAPGFSFVGLARAAGYATAVSVTDAEAFSDALAQAVGAKRPGFVHVHTAALPAAAAPGPVPPGGHHRPVHRPLPHARHLTKRGDLVNDLRMGIGVHSPITALLAEEAADVLWLGSLEMSTSRGVPDQEVLEPQEIAGIIRSVRAVTSLPIYVDADTGRGSDDLAVLATKLYEEAGADAICVEDNLFPKRNSLDDRFGGRKLLDPEAFAYRISAMVAARSSLKVVARTEALVAYHGADAAVERLHRYADAGADALFAQANRASATSCSRWWRRSRRCVPWCWRRRSCPTPTPRRSRRTAR